MAKQVEDFDSNLAGEEGKESTRTSWFKRIRKGILTGTHEKKETPEGLWTKCPECNFICTSNELKENLFVCPKCSYHHRIGSEEYYSILFDDNQYEELFENILSKDYLEFTDLKPYKKRLEEIWNKTDLKDSMRVAVGNVAGNDIVIACMDFEFIGGSLGSVMESAFSLMQLAKTSGKLSQLSDAKIPYISFLSDPTFGGISASFGMLGDLNIAEPGALIGFAGPRVIKETIKKDLPPGFQRSEFILEHGFLDFIVPRKELKDKMTKVLWMFKN